MDQSICKKQPNKFEILFGQRAGSVDYQKQLLNSKLIQISSLSNLKQSVKKDTSFRNSTKNKSKNSIRSTNKSLEKNRNTSNNSKHGSKFRIPYGKSINPTNKYSGVFKEVNSYRPRGTETNLSKYSSNTNNNSQAKSSSKTMGSRNRNRSLKHLINSNNA